MNLIIDVGNTRVKLALYKGETLERLEITSHSEVNKVLKKLIKKGEIEQLIVSTVGNDASLDKSLLKAQKTVIFLDHATPVPFKNKYRSPDTLGVDRIALVSAAAKHYSKKDVLVIDAGTCITYDFMNKKNEYLGGAISPGLQMRFEALHRQTARLPRVQPAGHRLIGKDTETSILSGVINGTIQEINGVIEQYCSKYPTLTVVLTGGDANFLAKKLKSSIFAIPNFLLEGLNSILIYNTDGWLKK